MSAGLEIQLIAILVAGACSILGVFLVLKSMAMVSDAITHTILLGIVLAFFIVHDLNSPLLIIGAGIIGVLTVYLVEFYKATEGRFVNWNSFSFIIQYCGNFNFKIYKKYSS